MKQTVLGPADFNWLDGWSWIYGALKGGTTVASFCTC